MLSVGCTVLSDTVHKEDDNENIRCSKKVCKLFQNCVVTFSQWAWLAKMITVSIKWEVKTLVTVDMRESLIVIIPYLGWDSMERDGTNKATTMVVFQLAMPTSSRPPLTTILSTHLSQCKASQAQVSQGPSTEQC